MNSTKKIKKEKNIKNSEENKMNEFIFRKEQMLKHLSLAVNGLSVKQELILKNKNNFKK